MGKSATKLLQCQAVEFKGFLWGIRLKPHQGNVNHDSPERAQEILKENGWKLSGELSICNLSYCYTALAALGTMCWSRHTLGLMAQNPCVPMPHLGTQEPLTTLILRDDPENHIRPSAQVTMPSYKC